MKKRKQHSPKPGPAPKRPAESGAATTPAQARASAKPAPPAAKALPPEPAPVAAAEREKESSETDDSLRIIGIGASAGGLAAFEALFAHLPTEDDTGLAFVVVQHLDPDHKSILSELVRRYTRMRVREVSDGMEVEANCTYIIPPNKDLSLAHGKLGLTEPEAKRGLRLPIDFFFRSLARDRGEQSIGIILSGNGTDGTLGLRAIKEAGGMAIVQEPTSAEYDGMPRSAIASGLADYVLPPEEMAAQLLGFVKRATPFKPSRTEAAPADLGGWLPKIMTLLRTRTGHDFSNYKQNTIRRRLERRMVVNEIESLQQYVRTLRQNPVELDTLFRELLIGVTGFFRDPPAFEAVRDLALPSLLTERLPNTPIRIWVPGCSTGEEAYSLAMLVHEAADKVGRDFVVQVFATDIDHESIEKARAGIYPANIAADVSPERLARFFTQEERDFYRVKKTLRDQIVFAEQDVIKDPPFSKLGLISCRNMLIYMESVLQKRLLPLFHYSLAPGGYLLLGNSESIGEFTTLFSVVERKWKLYRRLGLPGALASFSLPSGARARHAGTFDAGERKLSLRELTERALLRNYAPACVTVNEQGEILYVHERSGKYLELPAGEPTLNVVRAAREGLKLELANALRKVLAQRQPVHCQGLEVRINGGFQRVDVTAELADGPASETNLVLITFRESPKKPEAPAPVPEPPGPAHRREPGEVPDAKDRRIANLERELHVKSETLQTTIEELETSNEELKSTNEELQSTNEELQSTNEELETSKEELQSVNEELVTVNTELQQKMDGLSQANNDMNNLLAGTGIGMLFVDHQLHIQRFTPATTQIINLIQTDLGRPVGDLVPNLVGHDRLARDVQAVLDNLIPREAEVRTRDGRWYLMRILPYRTLENVIEGVVLTFVDIAAQKKAEEQFRTFSSELEQRVHQRVAELEQSNLKLQREIQQRQEAEARRVSDIGALTRMHDLAAGMAGEDANQKLLQTAVEAGIEVTRAHMGTLHVFDPASQTFQLAAHRGLRRPFLDHFQQVNAGTASTCGEALRKNQRVVVEDIAQSPIFSGTASLGVLQAAGVRAAQSTPVFGRGGRLLALLSTHWSEPYRPDEGTLRLLDLLARQLADLLEPRKPKE